MLFITNSPDPRERVPLRLIHVAKGKVNSFVICLFQDAGYKVVVYTPTK